MENETDRPLEYIPLKMLREDLGNLPRYQVPSGYRMRAYKPGDELNWAVLESAAGSFGNPEEARQHFEAEFDSHEDALRERCLFMETEWRQVIGTATAWFGDDIGGRTRGRLHWVAITPGFQDRGLGKPLVSAAMEILQRHHDSAYLVTQTTSPIAIRIYLDFGFVPVLEDEESRRGWRLLTGVLEHPLLRQALGG